MLRMIETARTFKAVRLGAVALATTLALSPVAAKAAIPSTVSFMRRRLQRV